MVSVYVGLGGNIGDTVALIAKALALLQAHCQVKQLRSSSLYRTAAISSIQQRDFVNAVCTFHTDLSPQHLLTYTQHIERQLGKVPKAKDAPRAIDLDLLLYAAQQVTQPDLQIPHPRWTERLFVLLPLAELTATVWLPTPTGSAPVAVSELLMAQLQKNPQRIQPLLFNERIDPCIP